ncbi:Uncharacterised protein [Mesomycoplasma conjunctivae]|uniref:CONSERVED HYPOTHETICAL Conserved hypothetical prolipoprotein n=1 Tax=Mesomycoplasma conjunctivae (strain ATCC 25834 / NCTC 10147 / HRC/581) TaxID=572263 RepID=C5J5M7_MESCH|nr:hypothetical protein [Mesomycoplasma conjunctivae]CAT04750.1 CONSERVED HYPOTHETICAL Conserved hypothetical prolipoprotein [Mesomycoplasma conjunctivae]VEU65769.1 Uncharacterised protein [Mesomycoplasma conjunctivae]
MKLKIKNLILSATAIAPLVVVSCGFKSSLDYLDKQTNEGVLNMTFVDEKQTFVSLFLGKLEDKFIFITSGKIDASNLNKETKIRFKSHGDVPSIQVTYNLLVEGKIQIEKSTDNYSIFSLTAQKITQDKKSLSSTFKNKNATLKNFNTLPTNEKIDEKLLFGFAPIFDYSELPELFFPEFFVSNSISKSKLLEKTDSQISFENKGKINDRFFGAPLIYKNWYVGILKSYKNEEKDSKRINITDFYLFTQSDIDAIKAIFKK